MNTIYWVCVFGCLWLLDRTIGVTITEVWQEVLAERRRVREEEKARRALE